MEGVKKPAPVGAKGKAKKQLRVTMVRSGIGRVEDQKRTLEALKLHHPGNTRVVGDTPQVRGMLAAVAHLVEVEEL